MGRGENPVVNLARRCFHCGAGSSGARRVVLRVAVGEWGRVDRAAVLTAPIFFGGIWRERPVAFGVVRMSNVSPFAACRPVVQGVVDAISQNALRVGLNIERQPLIRKVVNSMNEGPHSPIPIM